MQRIDGVVQHYAWGDRRAIPDLLGRPADGRPWAELWLGTHPNGPSRLLDGTPLESLTGPLPYLLKVLAAAEPLSLQAHPDAAGARAGFEAGRYPDANPKPEMLIALTPFDALCGFRPPADTAALLARLGPATDVLADLLASAGTSEALAALYRGRVAIAPIVDACRAHDAPEARLVSALAEQYPGDPSVVSTLLLNLVRLVPGEAVVLRAGTLHAHLGGVGVEFMAASDNVVRGGLTTKAVDIDDLLAIVDTAPLTDPVIGPRHRYDLPGTSLHLERLDGPAVHHASGHELVVSVDETGTGETGYLAPGTELVVAESTTAFVAGG